MLSLIPTPIGNISDITIRSLQVLSTADIILCEDTRVSKKLLHLLQERYDLKLKDTLEFKSLHSHNEDEFIKAVTPQFFEQNIIYMSDAGMPGISDPGQVLVKYAQHHGLEYDILTGANAALTAFVASGFDGSEFSFMAFLPHKGEDRAKALNRALYNGFTTILYESPKRLVKLLNEIDAIDSKREIFLAKELTKKFQTFYRGSAKELLLQLDSEIKGEWVVVISSSPSRDSAISERDILELDIPKKVAAKLISKITNESPKECYNRLINKEEIC